MLLEIHHPVFLKKKIKEERKKSMESNILMRLCLWIIDPFYMLIDQSLFPLIKDSPLSISSNLDNEFDIKFFPENDEITKSFYQVFNNFFDTNSHEKRIPIAILTFYLSCIIAADPVHRANFYQSYDGHVPVITQFLFDNIRIGSLGPIHQNQRIIVDPEKGDSIIK